VQFPKVLAIAASCISICCIGITKEAKVPAKEIASAVLRRESFRADPKTHTAEFITDEEEVDDEEDS
jgi:hypothetical protein